MGTRRRAEERWAITVLVTVIVLVAIAIIRGTPGESPRFLPPRAGTPSHHVAPQPPALPSSGPGAFTFDTTTGPIVGTAGSLKRYRVGAESNVVGELPELVDLVEATLADPRSWIAAQQFTFQRVPDGAAHDFTILLATRETAGRLCSANGMDIRVDGVPYTSCQLSGKVVINLDRWRLSVPDYGAPLRVYREYVINHEVGHELGRAHEPCPGPGRRAPVMLQQTLGLQGCTANPWPFPDSVT